MTLYQQDAYSRYRQYMRRFSDRAREEWKRLYTIYQRNDNELDSESQKRLKFDQSGNSGEPLEQSDSPHYSSSDPKRPKIGVRSLTKEDIQKREKQRKWHNKYLKSLESEDKLRYPSW